MNDDRPPVLLRKEVQLKVIGIVVEAMCLDRRSENVQAVISIGGPFAIGSHWQIVLS